MLKNTETSYGLVAKAMHWVMAALIIALIAIGYYMTSLEPSDDKWYIYTMHKSTGVLFLILILMRIIFLFLSTQPKLQSKAPSWSIALASINVFLLYFLMLAQPLVGFLGSLTAGRDVSFYNIFTIKAFGEYKQISSILWNMHSILPYLLIACIVAHLLGALYHQFFLKDNIMRRMWG
ncbi:MAG: cytochrome b [Pseudomonadota bacterium]